MMKKKGMDSPMDYANLSLNEDDDPLLQKFKFPYIRKYTGINDPHLHLKQYVTYMKTTGLNKSTNHQAISFVFGRSIDQVVLHFGTSYPS